MLASAAQTNCLENLRLSNAEGPKRAIIGYPSDIDVSNGSLANDCAAIACLLRSNQPFLLGRPSMGSEIRMAHAAYILDLKNVTADAELARVAGIVTSEGASARDFGLAYGAAIAQSDLVGKVAKTHAMHAGYAS